MTQFTLSIQDHKPISGDLQLPTPEPLPHPPGDWKVSLHDFETSPYFLPRTINCTQYPNFCKNGEPIRNTDGSLRYPGMPEMIPLYSGVMVKVTRPWQWFCVDLLAWAKYHVFGHNNLTTAQMDTLVRDFTYLFGGGLAWANGKGSDTCANYIAGTNLDQGPIRMETLTCGGKLLKRLSTVYHAGEQYYRCEALDMELPPPDIRECNPATHPWLFTMSVIARYDGKVIQFPRPYPMYVPFQDVGGVAEIKKRRTRALAADEPFPPSPLVG